VDRNITSPVEQCVLDLFGEQADTARLAQGRSGRIPGSGNFDQLDFVA
jgi:hypothetical protein